LQRGVYVKDVILTIISKLGVSGATDCVLEFRGDVVSMMDMEERMTLCNMAIEAGATCGICLPDEKTVDYLWKYISDEFAAKEQALESYSKWRSDPNARYERTLSVDVSSIVPVATVGYKPDEVKPLSELSGIRIDQVYIGSCTNGRLSDLHVAAAILKGRKLASNVRGIVSPATPDIWKDAMADGTLSVFQEAGFCITNPTCGACLGMSNGVLAPGEVCASTTNRNFNGRMGAGGMVHLLSPASAAAAGVKGFLCDPHEFL